MNPNEIFTDQPVSLPAGLVYALLQYVSSKPSGETANLLIALQQSSVAQLQAVEAAYNALNPTEAPAETTIEDTSTPAA